ncbi:Acyl-CoA N-acyltransferase [Colletotrichum asianum]|uniref:Putative GNAT family N-acetyltransferase n=1 Tax=Colletotrichum asianum TaxID=702518 RepID=A0A8H3WCP8_9PEZI|nr:putative GNAT family N-acetyltransferase [Colletotrichum asianum]
MESTASQLRNRKWTRDCYLISTDTSLVPIPELNAAFASEEFYWGKPLPAPVMRETLQNSLCFALYDIKSHPVEVAETLLRAQVASSDEVSTPKAENAPTLLGFGRIITDYTTIAFVTDVWVHPSTQGKGLGTWLVQCLQEVIESMPHLRRSMLLTGSWDKLVPFYQKLMKMDLMNENVGKDSLAVMTMI